MKDLVVILYVVTRGREKGGREKRAHGRLRVHTNDLERLTFERGQRLPLINTIIRNEQDVGFTYIHSTYEQKRRGRGDAYGNKRNRIENGRLWWQMSCVF